MTEASEFSTIGYLTLMQNGQISEINSVASKLMGIERSGLLQRNFTAFVACEDQDHWIQCCLTKKQGEPGSLQLILQRCDGTALHAQLQYIHQIDEAGSPVIRIFLLDTMLQKQTDNALYVPNRRDDYLFLFSPVIVYTCDAFSPHSAKFISINLTKILGYTL